MFKKYLSIKKALNPISLESARHDFSDVFLKEKYDLEKLLNKPISESSILVMGCGYKYPDVLLFSNICKEAIGVDVISNFYRDGFFRTYTGAIKSGKGILKSLLYSFKRRRGTTAYYSFLEKESQTSFNHKDTKIIKYSGHELPFENNKFDIVISNAVLEHVMDLNSFFSEASRVTKKGGISYHLYHNYYSFSGGHMAEIDCLRNPWGHLRGIYQTSDNHLNKAKIEDILQTFELNFQDCKVFPTDKNHNKKGVDSNFLNEREDLLSDELLKSLYIYPRDLLLSRGYLLYGFRS